MYVFENLLKNPMTNDGYNFHVYNARGDNKICCANIFKYTLSISYDLQSDWYELVRVVFMLDVNIFAY